ncbi:hypothetical protein EZ444_03855 [Pedobacter hiemivivus]|uniref:Uncharacterized protein n=1 Tax=Pedobacter hiemivivus TaxID=2530454 RepID=A0A4R0NE70_9SPHI|nr:hypothetical protein EZ444_03855 [Pedobacter hiemivivus]
MKKFILLLLCTATLGLASCKKDTIIQDTPNRTYNFTIQPNQWVLSQDGLTYTYEWRHGAIDQVTVDDEGVLVYLSHPINSNSYIQLPYTFNVDAYSYELFNGGIAIDIQSSDNQDVQPIRPTRAIVAKVVVIPSLYSN